MKDITFLETHYMVPENQILPDTRNRVCDANVAIIREIIKILDPKAEFEIYLLPPQEGSYRDTIKLIFKEIRNIKSNQVIAGCTVGILVLTYLNYSKKPSNISVANQQLEFLQKMNSLGLACNDDISDAVKEVCNSISLRQEKNKHYNILKL